MTLGALLAGAAIALSVAALGLWAVALRTGRMGRAQPFITAAQAAAVAGAVAALFLGSSTWTFVAAAIALLASGPFLMLGLQAAQPQGVAVAVGDPVLDFTAIGSDGQPFNLSSLHGKPYLLKFYRGHW